MLNIRTLILSIVLVVIFIITVGLVIVRTEVVSDPSSDPASVLDNQEQSANQNYVDITRSYRSRLGECFDVSPRELANCRSESQAPVPSYRSGVGMGDLQYHDAKQLVKKEVTPKSLTPAQNFHLNDGRQPPN